jgi:hypothetical protein
VKFEVAEGFLSRNQAEKFQVSPGWTLTGGDMGMFVRSTVIPKVPKMPEY